MKKLLFFFFFFFFLAPLSAQAQFKKEIKKNLYHAEQKVKEVKETAGQAWEELGEPEEGELKPFRPSYFLLWGKSSYSDGNRQAKEAQFQLSFQKEVTQLYGWKLIGAYTQQSYWQIFNKEDSRPFRETNFSPQIFIKSPYYSDFPLAFEGGYIHQSNGGREPLSRSWDRLFVGVYHKSEHFSFNQRFWRRNPEQAKEYENDPLGDENPDIEDYYGVQEGHYQLMWNDYQLYIKERYNFTKKQGMIETQVTGKIPKSSMRWLLHHFTGYGESLADYDRSLTKWGFGVIFSKGNI